MKIIYGPKGTGKTKAIIDLANQMVKEAKGHVVFITDTTRYSLDLQQPIRLLDTGRFSIKGEDGLCGFIKGVVAANGDNEYIFLDGVARISDKSLSELGEIFGAMESLEKDFGVKFIITASAAKEDLPDFVLKFVE